MKIEQKREHSFCDEGLLAACGEPLLVGYIYIIKHGEHCAVHRLILFCDGSLAACGGEP